MYSLNFRKGLYFAMYGLRGIPVGAFYKKYLNETQNGIPADTTRTRLICLLEHCARSVPYYATIMEKLGGDYKESPEKYIQQFPILTKKIIRESFEDLKSKDLDRRKWYYNTSGGSTGEPGKVIHDYDYTAQTAAVTMLYNKRIGCDIGEPNIKLWGSLRDITQGSMGFKAKLQNWFINTTFLNTFHMSAEKMRQYIQVINSTNSRLITGYAESLFEISKLAQREGIQVTSKAPVISSAGTLYPITRQLIENVFPGKLYNRYGCREVGDIACEQPGVNGLWIAPWTFYVEVVDQHGNCVENGIEGDILVTSLANYAMPLIRFSIGDRGVLAEDGTCSSLTGQVFKEVTGRSIDMIVNARGEIISAGYLLGLLYLRDWIGEEQIVQKDANHLEFRIVPTGVEYSECELEEIKEKVKLVMGNDCQVDFHFVNEIPQMGTSGKYRYVVSEVNRK